MTSKRLTEATMEITTIGSFERQDSFSRPSTSHSVTSTSQLSLEYLPPEAPYFNMVDVNPEIVKGEGDRSSRSRVNHPQETPQLEWRGVVNEYEIDTSEDTDELYHRVMELSDNIQQKLEESTGSYRRQSMSDTIPVGEGRSDSEGDEDRARSNNSPQTTAESTDIPDSATPTSGCPSSADTRRPTASSCSSRVSEKGGFHFEDTKTQKAYERMLKLDEKLASVCRREREVKERRRLLEEEMERVGAGQPTNELMARGDDSHIVSPVFPTEPNEKAPVQQSTSLVSDEGLERLHSHPTAQESPATEGKGVKRKKKDVGSKFETDFVKRNIELASDASSLIMMTKAEKQRLEELLEDNMEMAEVEDGEDHTPSNMSLCLRTDMPSAFGIADRDLERLQQLDSQLEALRPTMSWTSAAILSSATPSAEFSSTGLTPRLQAGHSEGNSAVTPAMTEGDTTVEGGLVATWSPGAEEGGSQLGMELSLHQMRETEEGKEEVKEEEEAGSQMELLRHLCVPHSDLERLRVIDERLRLISEENQSDFQGSVLDGQILAELIERSKAELLALAIPEAGDSLTTTQTDKRNQTVPGEVVTAPTEHEETREVTRLEDVPTGQNTESHHITSHHQSETQGSLGD